MPSCLTSWSKLAESEDEGEANCSCSLLRGQYPQVGGVHFRRLAEDRGKVPPILNVTRLLPRSGGMALVKGADLDKPRT